MKETIKKDAYEAPKVTVVQVVVEEGFAISGGSASSGFTTEDVEIFDGEIDW